MISEEIYKLLFTSNSEIFIYHTPSNSGLSSLNDLVQFDLRGQKFLTRYTLSKKSTTWSFQVYMGVSENGGTPKSSILIGFSIVNHPFWGPPIFGNIHIFFRKG